MSVSAPGLLASVAPEELALFQSMVESAPAYFYVADPRDASTVYRSPQAVTMLGYSREEWAANPKLWAQILHPDDRDRVLAEITVAIRGGKPFRSEYRIEAKSGAFLWVRDHGTLVANPNGPGMIFQGVVMDITEQMEAAQAAQRTEERLAVLLRSTPVALLSVTPVGVITVAGGSGLERLGLAPDDLVGRSIFEVFAGEPDLLRGFEGAVALQEVSGEVYHHGLGRWFDASTTPVFESGRLVAVTIIATDSTDRREVDKARFESEAKSHAVAAMSHELRTPLNSILGFSQLLRDGTIAGELNERQRRYVENVLSSGEHLLALVNDILDLAKSRSSQSDIELTDVNVGEAAARAVATVRPLARAKKLSLSQEVPEGLLLRADARRLHQVLLNLLANAIRFTTTGGIVVTSDSSELGWVAITVADSGIGISTADQALIFEEFVQLGPTWAGGQPGTGLGLSLTRSFLDAMGGTINIVSAPGSGSRFTFRLPAA